MRLIVIRHGETEWNIQHRYQGQLDSPLTDKGRAQAVAIGERLAVEKFDRLVSSDLGRAIDTAKAIACQHNGLPWDRNAGLRERNFGILAGYTRAEAAEKFPIEEEAYLHGGVDYRIPEGESLRDVFHRAGQVFDGLAEKYAGQKLCVVTHGGMLGMFLRHATGIPAEHARTYKFVNAAYNEFSHENGRWLLHTWGDVAHLGGIGAIDDL